MNSKKYIIKMIVITCFFISNIMASGPQITVPLSKEEITSLASIRSIIPTEITKEDINNLFVGSKEMNGHTWTLENLSNPDALKEIMSRDFVVQLLSSDNEQFICTPFTVDAGGQLRFDITVRDLIEGLNFSETPHVVHLALETQLTDKELELPVVQRFQSPFTFEEMCEMRREAHQETEKNGEDQDALAPYNKKDFLEVEYPNFVTMWLLLSDPFIQAKMLKKTNKMYVFFSLQ